MALPRQVVRGLEECLKEHAGLELPRWIVEERAKARIVALGVDPKSYLDLVRGARGTMELGLFTEAVRVGETRFFRHPRQFDAVASVAVSSWQERGIRKPKVWSVGCATGEEPYTL